MDLRDQIRQQIEKDKKDRGFGDTFERLMIFTGIKRLVKWIYGDKDCGCDRRKIYGTNGFHIIIKRQLVRKNK